MSNIKFKLIDNNLEINHLFYDGRLEHNEAICTDISDLEDSVHITAVFQDIEDVVEMCVMYMNICDELKNGCSGEVYLEIEYCHWYDSPNMLEIVFGLIETHLSPDPLIIRQKLSDKQLKNVRECLVNTKVYVM